MEEKKMELYLIMSFVINFCAAFILIWTVGLLFYIEVGSFNRAKCGNAAYQNINPFEQLRMEDEKDTQEPDVAKSESEPEIINVEVNDNGFLSKGFQASSFNAVTIVFVNNGTKAHSFVIDELDVDSGAVESGQTKTITIRSLPQENKVYNFYSGVSGDREAGFSGLMMVWD